MRQWGIERKHMSAVWSRIVRGSKTETVDDAPAPPLLLRLLGPVMAQNLLCANLSLSLSLSVTPPTIDWAVLLDELPVPTRRRPTTSLLSTHLSGTVRTSDSSPHKVEE